MIDVVTTSAKHTDAEPAGSEKTVVGVVGVGAMGLPMAMRLHAGGLAVRAVDVSASRVSECREHGLQAGTDLGLLAGADVVLAMVATGSQLLELLDAKVVTSGRLAGTVLVVASTVGPEIMREAATAAGEHGIEIVDCPVSGGVAGARAGTLAIFAAGASAAIERAIPVLRLIGTTHVVGERPGDGQALKLVNQMLVSIHLVAAGEAVAFAERLGLDPGVVVRLLPTGAAASWMFADRGPRMVLPADQRPTETQLSIFVKDSGLVAAAAAGADSHFPLTEAARRAWLRAADLGLGGMDDSSVVEVFRTAPPGCGPS